MRGLNQNHLFRPSCANRGSSLLFHGVPWAGLLELKRAGNGPSADCGQALFQKGTGGQAPVYATPPLHSVTLMWGWFNTLNIYFIYSWRSRHFLQENPATVQSVTCSYILESYNMGFQRLVQESQTWLTSCQLCLPAVFLIINHNITGAVRVGTQSSSSLLLLRWHGSSEGPKHRNAGGLCGQSHSLALSDLENGPDHGWLNSWKRTLRAWKMLHQSSW